MNGDYAANGTPENNYGLEIGLEILNQIENGVKMALGYHTPMLTSRTVEGGEKQYGITFKVRVLPFLKSGKRGGRAKIMRLSIYLNGLDYYDLDLGYLNGVEWIEHFRTSNVDVSSLNALLLSLDSDTPTATNPNYWP